VSGPKALGDVYDEVMKELEARGLGAPDGRRSHVAAIDDSGITVADVWESREQLEAFAPSLMSVIGELGGPAPDIAVRPVHNALT